MPKFSGNIRKGKFNPLNRRKTKKIFIKRTGVNDRRTKSFVVEEQNKVTKNSLFKVEQFIGFKDLGHQRKRKINPFGIKTKKVVSNFKELKRIKKGKAIKNSVIKVRNLEIQTDRRKTEVKTNRRKK